MLRALTIIFAAQLSVAACQAAAEDILLRLKPDTGAPVITRIIATEKVLLDAAPAGENWKTLQLEIPFEGYVPTATLTKAMDIVLDTPVHFLPSANSDVLTKVEEGDIYELLRAKDGWTTVGYKKRLKTYFRANAGGSPAPEPIPEAPVLNLGFTEPVPSVEPNFDPNAEVGQTTFDELPPENVVWKSTPRTPNAVLPQPQPQAVDLPAEAPLLPDGIMVGPAETQAREIPTGAPESDKPLRLLTGTLVREITTVGPAYPIRLRSPEGRLIAYVDFSGIFIEDFKPYLNQRVFLRGQIFPLKPNDSQLVIFAEEIRLAN